MAFMQSDKDTLLASVNSLANAIAAIAVDEPAPPPPSDLQAQLDAANAHAADLQAKLDKIRADLG